MKIRFIGDPRYPDDPAKAADPEVMVYFGKEFPKHKWIHIGDDGDDLEWAKKHSDKLRVSSHFEVSGKMNEVETPQSKEYAATRDNPPGLKSDKEEPQKYSMNNDKK